MYPLHDVRATIECIYSDKEFKVHNMTFMNCCNKYCYTFQEYMLITLNISRHWKVSAVTRHLRYVI